MALIKKSSVEECKELATPVGSDMLSFDGFVKLVRYGHPEMALSTIMRLWCIVDKTGQGGGVGFASIPDLVTNILAATMSLDDEKREVADSKSEVQRCQEALRESRASDQEARALLATLQHQHKESAEREKTFQATIETLCAENEELKRIQQEHTSFAGREAALEESSKTILVTSVAAIEALRMENAELKKIQQEHTSCAELHEEIAELKAALARYGAIHDNQPKKQPVAKCEAAWDTQSVQEMTNFDCPRVFKK